MGDVKPLSEEEIQDFKDRGAGAASATLEGDHLRRISATLEQLQGERDRVWQSACQRFKACCRGCDDVGFCGLMESQSEVERTVEMKGVDVEADFALMARNAMLSKEAEGHKAEADRLFKVATEITDERDKAQRRAAELRAEVDRIKAECSRAECSGASAIAEGSSMWEERAKVAEGKLAGLARNIREMGRTSIAGGERVFTFDMTESLVDVLEKPHDPTVG